MTDDQRAIVDELLADLDRVTAERDFAVETVESTGVALVEEAHLKTIIAAMSADLGLALAGKDAEIERLRDLAAALDAEDGRALAHKIRNEIIASSAPYWALDGGGPETTADEVRAEVQPVLKDIIHACSDVLGDGFYP